MQSSAEAWFTLALEKTAQGQEKLVSGGVDAQTWGHMDPETGYIPNSHYKGSQYTEHQDLYSRGHYLLEGTQQNEQSTRELWNNFTGPN